MDRRIVIKSKMEELARNFQPFLEECEKRGYPIKKIRFREMWPGDVEPNIDADVWAEWAPEKGWGYARTAGFLEDILNETVPKEQQDGFQGFNVEDTYQHFMRYERPEPNIQLLAG